jgi:DNA-directed RNA polymerase subunit RPC12/RpoP
LIPAAVEEEMAYYCHKCRNEIEFIVKVGIKVGRLDTCPHCSADMHVCKNCRFYDPSLHNQCRIPEADFIRERDVANFCHHFDILDRDAPPEVDTSEAKARAKLAEVFKNLK